VHGLDDESLQYLAKSSAQEINNVEILLHWIQVLITDGIGSGVMSIPPPIMTRAYQLLSRGMVNLHNARKIADVPFPFPLSQIHILLLWAHSVIAPLVVALAVDSYLFAGMLVLIPMSGVWCLTFISAQFEQPFGDDANDLPLSILQFDMNNSLLMLLDPEAIRAPVLKDSAPRNVWELRARCGDPESRTDSAVLLPDQFLEDGEAMRTISGEKDKSDSDSESKQKTHPSRQVTGHTQDGTIADSTISAMNPPGSPPHGAKAAPKVVEALDHQGKLRKKKSMMVKQAKKVATEYGIAMEEVHSTSGKYLRRASSHTSIATSQSGISGRDDSRPFGELGNRQTSDPVSELSRGSKEAEAAYLENLVRQLSPTKSTASPPNRSNSNLDGAFDHSPVEVSPRYKGEGRPCARRGCTGMSVGVSRYCSLDCMEADAMVIDAVLANANGQASLDRDGSQKNSNGNHQPVVMAKLAQHYNKKPSGDGIRPASEGSDKASDGASVLSDRALASTIQKPPLSTTRPQLLLGPISE